MAEQIYLFQQFDSFKEAAGRARDFAGQCGRSPIVKRVGGAWGIFAPEQLLLLMQTKESTQLAVAPLGATLAERAKKSARAGTTKTLVNLPRAVKKARSGTWTMSTAEAREMADELRHVYRQLSRDEASEWLGRTLRRFGLVSARRIRNLGRLALTLIELTGDGIISLIRSVIAGNSKQHVGEQLALGSSKVTELLRGIRDKAGPLMRDLADRPSEVGPDLLVAALAFYVAGGGFDGDGGIPDTDIALLGIDAHRSIFTHSIIAGAVVETSLYALVDFVAIGYRRLPPKHNKRWTLIHDRFERVAMAGSRGASLGLAYHLGVDGLIQSGAYHDLPFEISMQGHQAILTANAVAEGADVGRKQTKSKAAQVTPAKPSRTSGVVAGATALAAVLLGLS